jgi:NAD(P)-dependent dehydrogenase (short-subunit alcohol dehydrogenase family)
MSPNGPETGGRFDVPLALVTGASRGLGAELSRFLAGRGYDLVLNARHPEPLRGQAETLARFGGEVVGVAGDVADPACRMALRAAVERRGRLDLLLNNASDLGPSPLPSLLDADPSSFDRVFAVNVVAPVALIRELIRPLGRVSGMVINITSDASQGGYPGWGIYGASKAALDLVSLTLSKELSALRISVVAVDPGDMRTAMHQSAYPGIDLSDRPSPEATLPFFAWLLGQAPLAVSGQRFHAQGDTWELSPS